MRNPQAGQFVTSFFLSFCAVEDPLDEFRQAHCGLGMWNPSLISLLLSILYLSGCKCLGAALEIRDLSLEHASQNKLIFISILPSRLGSGVSLLLCKLLVFHPKLDLGKLMEHVEDFCSWWKREPCPMPCGASDFLPQLLISRPVLGLTEEHVVGQQWSCSASVLQRALGGDAFSGLASEGELCHAAAPGRGELSFCFLQSWAPWHPPFINPCSHTCSRYRTSGAPEPLLAPPTSAHAPAPRASLDFRTCV